MLLGVCRNCTQQISVANCILNENNVKPSARDPGGTWGGDVGGRGTRIAAGPERVCQAHHYGAYTLRTTSNSDPLTAHITPSRPAWISAPPLPPSQQDCTFLETERLVFHRGLFLVPGTSTNMPLIGGSIAAGVLVIAVIVTAVACTRRAPPSKATVEPPGYMLPAYPGAQGYVPYNYAPQGYVPQGYVPQGFVPQVGTQQPDQSYAESSAYDETSYSTTDQASSSYVP